jgi:hypothetical protein
VRARAKDEQEIDRYKYGKRYTSQRRNAKEPRNLRAWNES